MEETVYRDELKKIKLKQRQFYTKHTIFCNKDAFLQETSSPENQQKLLESSCINMIDELIINLEECEDKDDTRTINLEEIKESILRKYGESERKTSLHWYETR